MSCQCEDKRCEKPVYPSCTPDLIVTHNGHSFNFYGKHFTRDINGTLYIREPSITLPETRSGKLVGMFNHGWSVEFK